MYIASSFLPIHENIPFSFLSLVTTLALVKGLQASEQVPDPGQVITAGNYRLFLAAVAEAQDTHGFYQPEMKGQIICVQDGDEKNYRVIDGQEDAPMGNMTRLNAMRYCNWKEDHCPDEKEDAVAAALSTESGIYDLQDDQLIGAHPEAGDHLVNDHEGDQFFWITMEREEQGSSPLMMFGFFDGKKRESVSQEDRGDIEAGRLRGENDPSVSEQRGTTAHIGDVPKAAPDRVPGTTWCEMMKSKLLELWDYLKRFFCWRNGGEAALPTSVNGVTQPAVARLTPIDRLTADNKEIIETYIASRIEKDKSTSLSPDVLKDQIHAVLASLVDEQVRSSSYFLRMKFAFFESQKKSTEDTTLLTQIIPALLMEIQKMRNTPGKPIERASRASQQTIQAYIKRCMDVESGVSKSPEEATARHNEIEGEINHTVHQFYLQARPAALESLTPLLHQEKTENNFLKQELILFLPLEMKFMERIASLQLIEREIDALKKAVDDFIPIVDREALGPYKTYKKAQTLLETTNRTDALAGSEMRNTVKKLNNTIEEIKKIKIDRNAYIENIQSHLIKTELTWEVEQQIKIHARELKKLKDRFNEQGEIIAGLKKSTENFYGNLQMEERRYLTVLRSTEGAVISSIESINKLVGNCSYTYNSREGHTRIMETQAARDFQEVHDEYQECYEFLNQHKNKGFLGGLFSANGKLVNELIKGRDALTQRLAAEDRLEKEKQQQAAQQKAASAPLDQKSGATVPDEKSSGKKKKFSSALKKWVSSNSTSFAQTAVNPVSDEKSSGKEKKILSALNQLLLSRKREKATGAPKEEKFSLTSPSVSPVDSPIPTKLSGDAPLQQKQPASQADQPINDGGNYESNDID